MYAMATATFGLKSLVENLRLATFAVGVVMCVMMSGNTGDIAEYFYRRFTGRD